MLTFMQYKEILFSTITSYRLLKLDKGQGQGVTKQSDLRCSDAVVFENRCSQEIHIPKTWSQMPESWL